jgi:predicted PurR-regulated permease PerM
MRFERQLWFWLAAFVVFVLAINLLKDILLPFVAAIVGAYFLNPVADALEARGLKRTWAAVLIVGVVGVMVGLALVLLAPILAEQVRQLVTALPTETERFKAFVERVGRDWLGPGFPSFKSALERNIADLSANWASTAAAIMASVWSRGMALVNFLSLLLITPVIVFYLLIDWHPMLERIDKALPRDHAPTIRRLAGEINDAVAAFIRGQGAICLVLGVFYAVGLSWAGIDYGLLVGLSTGLLAFIPVIGWIVGVLCAGTLALVQFWPDPAPLLKAIGVLVAGIALDTAFLSPRFVGQKIGLHPVWMIFALFVFSYLFGLVGTLVAVPMAAAMAVLVRFAVQLYLDSSVYRGGDAEAHREVSGVARQAGPRAAP